LIVDNAAVHYGTDINEIVIFALESVGAKLIFLPAYSPELNPCELCFAIVK
jgi:transposase